MLMQIAKHINAKALQEIIYVIMQKILIINAILTVIEKEKMIKKNQMSALQKW